MEKLDNILVIAGSGQNVGKTTLACQILQNEKEKSPVAIKITPHFHKITKGLTEIQKGENWALFEEEDKTSGKDSSRYLQNGAVKSYLILAKDDGLQNAFSAIKKILPNKIPVLVESASLVKIIKPGLFLVVLPDEEFSQKAMERMLLKADLVVISDGKKFYPSPQKLIFKNTWQIK
ncbi:hypothetical protein GM418_17370 [Maribellus comscasis]|uniref:Molybdopterin-guanine dinucleotide biosynthesis protein B (MobB) domain-containing protein n=1 Tax=Maribellus comscasis TaxID=2681766 RepID=A0A6I6JWA4_9BACT|nr:hypothetical protein [Maribellus comscasis]QGY45378.1 hypothetical protein GM418_17370 [Maribellus comscasis]